LSDCRFSLTGSDALEGDLNTSTTGLWTVKDEIYRQSELS